MYLSDVERRTARDLELDAAALGMARRRRRRRHGPRWLRIGVALGVLIVAAAAAAGVTGTMAVF